MGKVHLSTLKFEGDPKDILDKLAKGEARWGHSPDDEDIVLEYACGYCGAMGFFPVHPEYVHRLEDVEPLVDADRARRTLSGWLRSVWINRTSWKLFWRAFSDLWRLGWSNWGCDGWHFIHCPKCDGRGWRIPPYEVVKRVEHKIMMERLAQDALNHYMGKGEKEPLQ